MSGDNKNEQSVMIPLDELFAQDPTLGGVHDPNKHSNVDTDKIDRIGLNQTTRQGAAPMNTVAIPARHGDVKQKRGAGKLVMVLSLLVGVPSLIAVGVYIGSLNQPAQQLQPVNQPAQTKSSAVTTPQTPTPQASGSTPAVAADAQETQEEPKTQVKVQAQVKAKGKAKPQRRRTKRSRAKSKPAEREVKAAAPEPQPEAQPKQAQPKRPSEAEMILAGRENPKPKPKVKDQPAPKSNLPKRLTTSQLIDVLNKNKGSTARCKVPGQSVKVKMSIVIQGSGRVSSATLASPDSLKGSKTETCLAQRIKLFKFPQFSSKSMRVKLPFRL